MKTEKILSLRLIKCKDNEIIESSYPKDISKVFHWVNQTHLYLSLFSNHFYSYMNKDYTAICYDQNEKLFKPDWYVEKMVKLDKNNIRLDKLKRILDEE